MAFFQSWGIFICQKMQKELKKCFIFGIGALFQMSFCSKITVYGIFSPKMWHFFVPRGWQDWPGGFLAPYARLLLLPRAKSEYKPALRSHTCVPQKKRGKNLGVEKNSLLLSVKCGKARWLFSDTVFHTPLLEHLCRLPKKRSVFFSPSP